MLDLNGCIVTIDAMGCQKDIAQKIVDRGADYLLAVKENQGQLYQDVRDLFEAGDGSGLDGLPHDYATTLNKGHGRIERRRCWVVDDPACPECLSTAEDWPGLRPVAKVESWRECGNPHDAAGTVLHQQRGGLGKAGGQGVEGSLEHRELAALELGRNLSGGSKQGTQRPRTPEHGYAETSVSQPAGTESQLEGEHPMQMPLSRLEGRLPPQSPTRLRSDCAARWDPH